MARAYQAFASAAISNFFAIHDEGLPSDLEHTGATGGGFVLSKGVASAARVLPGQKGVLRIIVNGDPDYEAGTTRTAIRLLLEDVHLSGASLEVTQSVEVPIGYGFGASAASALSGVRAVAGALRLEISPERLAYHAHAADILCRTGLGTVSVIYRFGGACIITKAGAPGVAEVRQVSVPHGLRIVTASLAPFSKSAILSSKEAKGRVNMLGERALDRAADLRLESLVKAGEDFARELGLESPQVERLIDVARASGAMGASQNMVGHAVHAVVTEEDESRVASALISDASRPAVETWGFATPRQAQTSTSSLV